MTDREIMQQALEALEPVSTFGRVGSRDVDTAKAQEAITALRSRLAQPEQGGKTGWPARLLQDDSRGLSKALASKPDARMRAREAAREAQATTLISWDSRGVRTVNGIPEDAQQLEHDAVLAEREACAALVDANAMACHSPIYRSLLQSNANAIRARGQE